MGNDIKMRLQVQDVDLPWFIPPLKQDVIEKIQQEKIKAVLVVPIWMKAKIPSQMVQKKYYYATGTKLFESTEKDIHNLPGTPWPIWALLVDGKINSTSSTMLDLKEDAKVQTVSAKRRHRRKFKSDIVC